MTTPDEEFSLSWRGIGLGITFIIQLTVLIWGASNISNSVDELKITVNTHQKSMNVFQEDLTKVKIDAAVRQERVEALERSHK